MLRPDEICLVMTTEGKTLDLPSDEAAWSRNAGRQYDSPGAKLDAADRGGELLVYRKSPSVPVVTPFLGHLPTADNVFLVRTRVSFAITAPRLACQSLPFGDHEGRHCVRVQDLGEQLAPHVRHVLSRLAGEYSVAALDGQQAAQAGAVALAEELNRVFRLAGLQVDRDESGRYGVVIERIEDPRDEAQLKHLVNLIALEAEQQQDLHEARRERFRNELFQERKREITIQAEQGHAPSKALADLVAPVASYEDLCAQAARVPDEVGDRATVTAPVGMNVQNEARGRFAVLSAQADAQYYEILRDWFFVGRDSNCHVPLASPIASSHHATVARIGSTLVIIDHASRNGTWYNGQRMAQHHVQAGDVIRIGEHWLAFKVEPSREFRPIDRSLRAAVSSSPPTLPRSEYDGERYGSTANGNKLSALVSLVSSAGRTATTDSRPILIGHDVTCDLRLAGGGVARFHAVVYWDAVLGPASGRPSQPVIANAGVFVEHLHTGRGLLRNRQPIERAQLADGDTLEVGGHRIVVALVGNVSERAKALYSAQPVASGLALTCIEGAAIGSTIQLDPRKERIVIGRDDGCDLVVRCPKVSGQHAEILRNLVVQTDGSYRPEFSVSDLRSTNGTFFNASEVKAGKRQGLSPGDVIRLGKDRDHCDLLIHQAS